MNKSFETCTPQYLGFTFGLQKVEDHRWLNNRLDVRDLPKNSDTLEIKKLRQYISENAESMNQFEFIAFVWQKMIQQIGFDDRNKYQFFLQRDSSAEVRDFNESLVHLYGNIDFIVTEKENKQNCVFFFHQDKTKNNYELDAKGHLLASMFAAQIQNSNPVYGCLMMEGCLYFAILDKKEYGFSAGFDIKSNDFYDILNILKKIKQEIEKNIAKKEKLLYFDFKNLEEDQTDQWSDKEMMLALKKIGV